jgi:hypothetical protein
VTVGRYKVPGKMSERWAVPGGTPRLKERSTRQLRTGLLSDRPWRDAASKRALHAALRTGLLSDRPCRGAPPKRTLHPGTSYRAAFVMSLIGSAKLFINLGPKPLRDRGHTGAPTHQHATPRGETHTINRNPCATGCAYYRSPFETSAYGNPGYSGAIRSSPCIVAIGYAQ